MKTFDEVVQAWREAPFPRGSSIDAVDEAHADLALYDSWVAESILPYVTHGIWEPAIPDVLGALDSFAEEMEALQAEGVEDSHAVASYVAYAMLLKDVYLAFLNDRKK